jgi:hypothetical protein
MLRAYNDPDYRHRKRWLRTHPTLCGFGCGQPATTLDHQPALAQHHHVRGSQCCTLVPACHRCNSSHGATLGNRLRNPTSEDW